MKRYAHIFTGQFIRGKTNIQVKLPAQAKRMLVNVQTVYTASPESRPETSRKRRAMTELKLLVAVYHKIHPMQSLKAFGYLRTDEMRLIPWKPG